MPTYSLPPVFLPHHQFPNGDNCEPNELANSCGNNAWVYFSCSHPILVNGATAPAAIGTLYTDYINPGNNAPRAYLEAGETSDWTQDCCTYWRLDGQGAVDPAWCANPPTSPPQSDTTMGPGSFENAGSFARVVYGVVACFAAVAIVFA